MLPNRSLYAALLLACVFVEINASKEVVVAKSRVLSRRKRYLTFPEGASFSTAVCLTVGVIGQPALSTAPGLFVLALIWGITYELPNETYTVNAVKRLKQVARPIALRRNRRELYDKVETIVDNMGYNGRECILKTLCETTQRIAPRSRNMMEQIFRTIFTLPSTKIFPSEPPEHAIYDSAYRLGKMMVDCDAYSCPLSLVDLVKGYYNAPMPDIDTVQSPLSWFTGPFS